MEVLIVEGLSSGNLMTASELEVAVVGDWDVDKRVKDQERDGVSAKSFFHLRPPGVLRLR